ncbi:hypothetical protein EBZ80_02485 [bacterium]|nr:hypothetical protein [bacterium]
MQTYQLGFWIQVSLVAILLVFIVWLAVERGLRDRRTRVADVGLEFLVSQYLRKSFQQVNYLLLRSTGGVPKLSITDVNIQQTRFIEDVQQTLSRRLVRFVRGREIVSDLQTAMLRLEFKTTDIFILPDAVLSGLGFYKKMLFLASEKTLDEPLEMEDEEAKTFINTRLSTGA